MSRSPAGGLTGALAVVAVVALAAAAVLGALLVAGSSPGTSPAPGETSVEAGFARDMQAHHRQAVTMSLLVLERTDDTEVRTLASDILLTQQQQVGQMHGWLDLWGLPQTGSEPTMAWMGHGAMAMGPADMPGMADAADLARLQGASGTDAERLYLQLMVPHHEGGVEMADAALAASDDPVVTRLAGAASRSQTSELTVLRTLLADRGGPLPG